MPSMGNVAIMVVEQGPAGVPSDKHKWELKELSVMHKQVCSLLAQGLGRTEISTICDITPEYVTMLAKQPLCMEYIKGMNEYVGARMEALFETSVDTMADAMRFGTMEERLKGARLQLEATKRLGRVQEGLAPPELAVGRLEALANRLTSLIQERRKGVTYEQTDDAEIAQVVQAGQTG